MADWASPRSGPSVAVYDRAGLLVLPPGFQVEQLALSTVINGGCEACRFVLLRKATLLYPDLDYNFDVRVGDAAGVFWRGKIERVTPVITDTDEYIAVEALGGGVASDDMVYTSHTFAAASSIEAAISTVVTDLMAQIVTVITTVTTGRSFTVNTTYSKTRARSILETLTAFGTSANVGLQWGVWPSTPAGAYEFVLEARPSTAAYSINVLDFSHQAGFDGSVYFNRVRVNYNNGATWTVVENTPEQTATGRIREQVVEAPDVTNGTDALNLGNTALALGVQRRVQATSGEVRSPFAVRDTNGLVVPIWQVRAGQLLYIQGRIGAGQAGGLDWGNTAYIKATQYNDDTGVLSLTFERDDTTLEGLLSRVKKTLEV